MEAYNDELLNHIKLFLLKDIEDELEIYKFFQNIFKLGVARSFDDVYPIFAHLFTITEFSDHQHKILPFLLSDSYSVNFYICDYYSDDYSNSDNHFPEIYDILNGVFFNILKQYEQHLPEFIYLIHSQGKSYRNYLEQLLIKYNISSNNFYKKLLTISKSNPNTKHHISYKKFKKYICHEVENERKKYLSSPNHIKYILLQYGKKYKNLKILASNLNLRFYIF
jgi:hypothetical protein